MEVLLSASRAIHPDDLEHAPFIAATEAARDRGVRPDAPPGSVLAAVVSRPDDFASTTFVFGDHDIATPDLKVVEGDFKEVRGDTPQSDKRGLICACSAGDEQDVLLRPSLTVLMFWFGHQSDLYAYHDIVRTEVAGRVSYFGRKSWRVVAATLGMKNVTKIRTWTADHAVAERMCDIAKEPKKERYVAMSPQATAAWLETDEGR